MHHNNIIAALAIVSLSMASLSAAFQLRPVQGQAKVIVARGEQGKSVHAPGKSVPMVGEDNAAATIFKATFKPAIALGTSIVLTPSHSVSTGGYTAINNAESIHISGLSQDFWKFTDKPGAFLINNVVPSGAKYALVVVNGSFYADAKSVKISNASTESTLTLKPTGTISTYHHSMIFDVSGLQNSNLGYAISIDAGSSSVMVSAIEVHFTK